MLSYNQVYDVITSYSILQKKYRERIFLITFILFAVTFWLLFPINFYLLRMIFLINFYLLFPITYLKKPSESFIVMSNYF